MAKNKHITERTLDELDGAWPEPIYGSHVVVESHRLRSIPIGQLTTEDLRLLIGQEIGLTWLVPIALRTLRADPLASGDFYPGDLLTSVIRVPAGYWDQHPDDRTQMTEVRAELERMGNDARAILAAEGWP